MSIHLVGGGWSEDLFRHFLTEADSRAAGAARVIPRIGVLLVTSDEASGVDAHANYLSMLTGVSSCSPVITVLSDGSEAESALLSDIDGLLIGGGLTPAYLDAITPIVDEIRLLVADGLPYAGFSAGAAIAGSHAVIGGWRIGGVPVCPEDSNEELDEVTVVEGIGLVPGAVDVHAAQWGNLSRLVAVVEAGLAPHGVAVDEDTTIAADGRVVGAGRVWHATRGATGEVRVTAKGRTA